MTGLVWIANLRDSTCSSWICLSLALLEALLVVKASRRLTASQALSSSSFSTSCQTSSRIMVKITTQRGKIGCKHQMLEEVNVCSTLVSLCSHCAHACKTMAARAFNMLWQHLARSKMMAATHVPAAAVAMFDLYVRATKSVQLTCA